MNAFGRAKNSITALSNAVNYTTLSLPQLKPVMGKSVAKTIIKNGTPLNVKAVKSSKKNAKKVLLNKGLSLSSKEKSSSDLMEKLLTEITAKYKSSLCKDPNYLQRLEKKSMI
jgi:hypothetical protein